MTNLNEDSLTEQPAIEMFSELGYEYKFGPDMDPDSFLPERKNYRHVILEGRLIASIRRLNPQLNESEIEEVVYQIKNVNSPNLEIANQKFYKMLSGELRIDTKKDGEKKGVFVKLIDFENIENNVYLVVNQLTIQGPEKTRRPDLVVFINGLPLAIFEFKNPTLDDADIRAAYLQIEDYKKDISDFFKYNQIIVLSDLINSRYGTISSSYEWFSRWRESNAKTEKKQGITELEVLIKGIFNRKRFLDILKNFIIFESDSEKEFNKFTKRVCLYHQYFGVNKAIDRTLKATAENGDKKIGVFWHTQGSGKSLSMVFYVNKTKKLESLKSPTFLFLTDREDLDDQLYKTFLRSGYNLIAKKASSINDLKIKLENVGAEIIFTTIQKFQSDKEKYPRLTQKHNIIVVADEAHRSEYAKLASNVRLALPNASFMGITGTPISLNNRDTRLVFGDYIDQYQINQAVEDEATVPIYYEGRLSPLHLANYFIDEEFNQITEGQDPKVQEVLKRKYTRLEQAVMAGGRLEKIVEDIISHFKNRGLEGKAMIVTISRKVAIKMYQLIKKIKDSPEVAVVISSPSDFKDKIQKEIDNKELEKRFKNPNDPLKIAIVCDMWLTGFDVPSLHTMYIDKPLKNHSLMQAIARVNRKYRDKPGGLIVDYIGIADDLKRALSIYSSDVQKHSMISIEKIIIKMLEKYDIVKAMFFGIDFSKWKYLEGLQLAELFQKAVNQIITNSNDGRLDENKKSRFLNEFNNLSKLFALSMPSKEAGKIRGDIEFFQAVKKSIIKNTTSASIDINDKLQTAIKDLVSKSIMAEGVIDIFAMKNKEKPDISIFDEEFLAELKNLKYKNLTIEILKKLLNDELKFRSKRNIIRYKSLSELLQKTIDQYEDNIINSSKVIERLIELAKEIKKVEKEGVNIGLTEEELAFYDVMSSGKSVLKKSEKIKDFVKELVRVIKRDLTVDWTNKEIIKARIKTNIKLMLFKNKFPIDEAEYMVDQIYTQARFLYKDFQIKDLP